METILARIQEHLAVKGHAVIVATYLRATKYTSKHAAMFRVQGDRLQVQSGRNWLTLGHGDILLVGIRLI